MPLDQKTICWKAAMQWARSNAIQIWQVGACDSAKLSDVEMRILGLSWIKAPLHQVDTSCESVVPLCEFQFLPDPKILVIRVYSNPVRVKPADCNRRECQGESNETVVIKRADDLSAVS
jgi:hypothetical protein